MNVLVKQSLFLVLVALFLLPTSAEAVPGFARQMGVECSSCHAQNIPKLNRFGREFARSGFTMSSYSGPQAMIEGSNIALGLPSVLNVSGILRASYTLTDGNETTGTDRGEAKVFDNSVLIFGGKFANNVGGLLNLTPNGFGGKGIVSYDALGGYTGFTLYSTGGTGAFSGMENYNTGLYTPLHMFNNAKSTNAAQATGVGRGAATGLQAFYGGAGLFASIGIYVPAQNSDGLDMGASLIPFGRLAYELSLGSWTITPGAYAIIGDAKMSDTALDDTIITPSQLINIEKEAYGLDLQLEGTIADMSTMVTINTVLKNKTTLDPVVKIQGSLREEDETATSLELQFNPITSLGLKAAFLTYDTKLIPGKKNQVDIDKKAYSFGLNYAFRQNILLDVEYSYTDPKDSIYDPSSSLFFMATAAF